ncbi:hypothetical protein OOK06_36630 [Streptomyces sp. NBC_00340]|uniref:hypothetical protein n=1 Tax=Streptomyces sp. NBC_00340 TaxID=2975716 RepID=UPI00224EADA2|nr:hypothetical protein [Streptomyces sp. NBC_00340]MCX5137597.1 hypothetical protein [Streptomyces sp. NBC_00340]
MHSLPEPTPTAPAAGQAHLDTQATQLLAAIEEAMHTPTSYRDDSPVPSVGAMPPVQQPGRPAMSQGATDASVLMLAGGATTSMVGLTAAALMCVSRWADPVVCALVFGAPTALALAIGRMLKRARQVMPDEHHHHYNGPVDQRHVHTSSKGVWVKNRNEQ